MKAGYFTPSTEAYFFAAQEQAISTNAKRSLIYREVDKDGVREQDCVGCTD